MDHARILKLIVAMTLVKAAVQSVWLDPIVRNAKEIIGVTQALDAEVTVNCLVQFLFSLIIIST